MNSVMNSAEAYQKWRLTLAIEAVNTRSLKCKYCRSSFRYKQSLNMHIKEAHMNPPQRVPTERYNQTINTNQLTKMDTERVAISQYKPARRVSVIIQNPNIFQWTILHGSEFCFDESDKFRFNILTILVCNFCQIK